MDEMRFLPVLRVLVWRRRMLSVVITLSRAEERSAEGAQPRPATSVNIGSTGQPV